MPATAAQIEEWCELINGLPTHPQNIELVQRILNKFDPEEIKDLLSREYEGLDTYVLSYACDKGHIEFIKFLLQHQPNLVLRDRNDELPIDYAVRNGNLEIIKLIADSMLKLENVQDVLNNCEKTALRLAVDSKSPDIQQIVQILLEDLKIDPDKGEGVNNPLRAAILNFIECGVNKEVVIMLLQANASIGKGSDVEDNIFVLAASNNGREAIELIIDYFGIPDNSTIERMKSEALSSGYKDFSSWYDNKFTEFSAAAVGDYSDRDQVELNGYSPSSDTSDIES